MISDVRDPPGHDTVRMVGQPRLGVCGGAGAMLIPGSHAVERFTSPLRY